MSGEVTLTAALRSNLLSLQNTQRLLDTTQLRLATGKKVNSALDDANAFFAAQSLSNRAGDLSRILDSLGQGIQVIQAADQGLTALTNLLEQAESIAQEAREQASGNAQALSTTNNITGTSITDVTNLAAVANGETFTLQAGTSGPVVTFTISTGDSLADVAAAIDAQANLAAQVVEGTTASGVTLQVSTTDGSALLINDGSNGAIQALIGADVVTTTTTTVTIAASTGVPADRVQLEADFTDVRSQINALITDTGYRGTNLLNGDTLTVDFNEDGSNQFSVNGSTLDTSATGLNVSAANFGTLADINNALSEIDAALDTVRATARSFGGALNIIQTREDFTTNLINVLNEGADKLTLADTNEEGAKLLSLQTSQQLGITSLALASQAQQSVLRLF